MANSVTLTTREKVKANNESYTVKVRYDLTDTDGNGIFDKIVKRRQIVNGSARNAHVVGTQTATLQGRGLEHITVVKNGRESKVMLTGSPADKNLLQDLFDGSQTEVLDGKKPAKDKEEKNDTIKLGRRLQQFKKSDPSNPLNSKLDRTRIFINGPATYSYQFQLTPTSAKRK